MPNQNAANLFKLLLRHKAGITSNYEIKTLNASNGFFVMAGLL